VSANNDKVIGHGTRFKQGKEKMGERENVYMLKKKDLKYTLCLILFITITLTFPIPSSPLDSCWNVDENELIKCSRYK